MKRLVITGALVFLIIAIVSFPARVAYRWLAPPDVQLTGIEGSIWNGSAREGMAAGAYVRDLAWHLKPASLFSGKLAFSLQGRPVSGSLSADVAVGFGGTLTLSSLQGRVPADMVHPFFRQNRVTGDLSIRFDNLVIRDGVPVAADGTITLAHLFVPGLSASPLGDYRATLHTTDQGIVGDVQDVGGVLEVTGIVELLPDRNYRLIGSVRARPEAPPSVEQQLRFLGSPDEHGMRPFRFEGVL